METAVVIAALSRLGRILMWWSALGLAVLAVIVVAWRINEKRGGGGKKE